MKLLSWIPGPEGPEGRPLIYMFVKDFRGRKDQISLCTNFLLLIFPFI